MSKRGRKPIKMEPLYYDRLKEALSHAKTSLRELDRDNSFIVRERTIRRAKKSKMINPEILNALGERLNVDPRYISGFYDRRCDDIAKDEAEAEELKKGLKVSDYPYSLKLQRDKKPFQYIEDLLIENGIPLYKLDQMPKEEFIQMYLELEKKYILKQ